MKEENKIKINTMSKHFDIQSKNETVNLRSEKKYETDSSMKTEEEFFKKRSSISGTEENYARDVRFFEKKEKTGERKGFLRKFRSKRFEKQDLHRSMESTNGRSMKTTACAIFDKTVLCLIYILVFTLPLFVLPFSMEIYEFNKTILLFFLSSLAFLIWIAKMVLVERRLFFVRTPLDIPIASFILLAIISTAFSVDKISSILGFYGRFSDSLLVYLSLAMLYFVVVNVATRFSKRASYESMEPTNWSNVDTTIVGNLFKMFLTSSFIVVIAGLLYSFGFKFIPWQETQFRSFNLIAGSSNIFGVYLVAVILIALGYRDNGKYIGKSLSKSGGSSISKHLMSALIIMSIFLLAIIDFVIAWIILAISLIVAMILIFIIRKKSGSLAISIMLIAVSLVFIVSSLTFIINKDGNGDSMNIFSSSAISTFIKNRIISVDDNQTDSNDGFNREIILDKGTAMSVAVKGVKQDTIAGIIGSGPGTYLYNFSKYKPAEFNNNLFWNIRFDKAGSEVLEKISTIGILGTLSYLLIVVLAVVMFLKSIVIVRSFAVRKVNSEIREDDNNNIYDNDSNRTASAVLFYRNNSFIYIFAAWFALLLFQFLYLEATTTKFIFWLLTAVLAIQYYSVIVRSSVERRGNNEATREELNNVIASSVPTLRNDNSYFILDIKKEKPAFYLSILVLIILLVSFVSAYYYQFKFYRADEGYKKVVLRQNEALANGDLSEEKIWEVLNKNTDELKEVISNNPYRGAYKIYLSDIYLNRTNLVFKEESKKEKSERNNNRIIEEAKNVIDYAKSAAEASSNNIIFQHKIADVYSTAARDIGIVGADEWAIKKYKKAIDLEPVNPVLHFSLGKVYALNYSTTKSKEIINQAINEFKKALELKENYLEAGLRLGIAYESKKDNQNAIDILSSMGSVQRIESVINKGQIDVLQNIDTDIAFHLGRIYYNTGKINEAKNIFTKIAKINPNYSNARYSLGLIYEKEKNYEDALTEFRVVFSLNPENDDVKNKINKLEGIIGNKKNEEIKKSEPESE